MHWLHTVHVNERWLTTKNKPIGIIKLLSLDDKMKMKKKKKKIVFNLVRGMKLGVWPLFV